MNVMSGKKLGGALLFVSVFLVSGGISFAQEITASENSLESLTELGDLRDQHRAEIEALRIEQIRSENPELAAEIEALRSEREALRAAEEAEFKENYPLLAAQREERGVNRLSIGRHARSSRGHSGRNRRGGYAGHSRAWR